MHTSTRQMGCLSMSWHYSSQKIANALPNIMILHALFVGMVEICFSVMDAQGHFIKVRFNLQDLTDSI